MTTIQPTAPDKLWTPANIVTLIRICLVPVFVLAILSPWPEWVGLPGITMEAKCVIAAGIFISSPAPIGSTDISPAAAGK